jgi:plasmid rolling circle replication initiator protein Rep
MVDKSYFGKKNQKYISHKDWIHLWRISARLDYDPNIDIRRIRNTQKNIPRTIAEIVKYTVKDTDYIVNDVVTKTLTDALHRVRLIAYGGVIADTRKALNILDEEKSDLINISDTVRDDVATAIIRYGWSFSVGDYIRQKSS